jgi:hypothetical protein
MPRSLAWRAGSGNLFVIPEVNCLTGLALKAAMEYERLRLVRGFDEY